MFTVEGRKRILDRLVEMARSDSRIIAGAFIGSTATGVDRWSDIDLTFGLGTEVTIQEILADWTTRLEHEFDAVPLFDLPFSSTIYRVFLFPGNLQVDLSFTPGTDFGALGPKFELIFGKASAIKQPPPSSAQHVFGLGVHHLVHAHICIERGRLWQAEYWISAARDQALALACLHRGLPSSYGRGFDDLPVEVLSPFVGALVGDLNKSGLLKALGVTIDEFLRNSQDVVDAASKLEPQLLKLKSATMQ
jgi:hypothetical protein